MSQTIIVSTPGEEGDIDFKLSRFAANRCGVIRAYLETIEEEQLELEVIPLPNMEADIMPKIIEFLEEPYEEREKGQLSDFETEWMPEDTADLARFLIAANYLDCQEMLDALTQHTANLIKGKTPEQLREMFKTPDDIPDEKKKEIHEQNKFLLEK